MNTMVLFVWLLPVIFMIHEFEEILMIEVWFTRYKEKIKTVWPKRMPFGLDHADQYLTVSIALGIFCQFVFLVLICILCTIFQNYYAWYGFVVGSIINSLLLHLRDFIKFKGYTPGIITALALIIPSIWMLYVANTILHYGLLEIVLSTILINGVGIILVFKGLHKAMASWSQRLSNYAKGETAK